MERIGIESMVPLPPALLPANAKPAFTFSLFSKNFIVLSIPHPQIAKSTDNIPAPALPHTMLVVKFLTGSNRAEFIKEPYAGIDTVNHHDVDIFQTYGEIENIADSDVATISKIKNFNPVTGFDLLKKGKILPIFMLSQDLKFNITQSIAFTKLIFHEIQTNPKFTTSSLQLV
jgi:hypothetical protein